MRGLVAFGFHLMGETVFWLKSLCKASTFINTLILSQHEGAQCLDDTTHIAKENGIRIIQAVYL
jgi:hypothetical protein